MLHDLRDNTLDTHRRNEVSPFSQEGQECALDRQTEAWDIKVTNVEIKDIDLNETMIRAIARQAEAERERRAKIINAEGEHQAAQKLLEAAEILSGKPEAMQLRYLGTRNTIVGERSSTVVFPFPIDFGRLIRLLKDEPSDR